MYRLSPYIGEIDIFEVENIISNCNMYFFLDTEGSCITKKCFIHYKSINVVIGLRFLIFKMHDLYFMIVLVVGRQMASV